MSPKSISRHAKGLQNWISLRVAKIHHNGVHALEELLRACWAGFEKARHQRCRENLLLERAQIDRHEDGLKRAFSKTRFSRGNSNNCRFFTGALSVPFDTSKEISGLRVLASGNDGGVHVLNRGAHLRRQHKRFVESLSVCEVERVKRAARHHPNHICNAERHERRFRKIEHLEARGEETRGEETKHRFPFSTHLEARGEETKSFLIFNQPC